MKKLFSIYKILLKLTVYLLIIVSFIAISVTIIFRTSGYTYNWKAHKIERLGLLVIYVNEKDYKIQIDGRDVTKDIGYSPINIFASTIKLKPGDHDLLVTKEGFQPWSRKITIGAEKVTKIDDAILFPSNPDVQEISLGKNVITSLSPNIEKIAYAISNNNSNEIWMLDTKSGNQEKIFPPDITNVKNNIQLENIESLSWSPDSNRLLVQYQKNTKQYLIIPTLDAKNYYLPSDNYNFFPFFKMLNFTTDPSILYGLDENGKLFKIDLQSKNNPMLIAEDIISYEIFNRWLYFQNNENLIFRSDIDGKNKLLLETDQQISPIKFIGQKTENMPRYILNGSTLYSWQEQNQKINFQKIADNLTDYLDLNDRLYFSTDFELWQVTEKEKKIISRISSKLEKILFYPEHNLLYVSTGSLYSTDFDGTNNIKTVDRPNSKTLDLKIKPDKTIIWLISQEDVTKTLIIKPS